MRLGGRVTLIVLVLAAGPSLGQAAETGWTQGRGDAGRSGIALLPGTPLDVVGTFNMLDADQALNVAGDGLAWTPWGIVGVEQPNLPNPTSTCRLFRFDLDTGVTTRVTEIPCPEGARLGGYDPVNDIAIVCVDGTPDDLLVRAFDSRSGAEAWGARPEISLAEARGVADQNEWACQSPAIDSDAGVAYVAFGNEQIGRHVIQAVSLVDGSTLWASTMPATAFTGSSSPMPPTTLGAVSGQVQGFNVDGVTLTDTGLVLFGRAGARTLAPAYAWMGLDGTPVGAVLPYSGDFARAAAARLPTGQSGLASASGDRAAALLTGELVFINPLSTDPEVIPIPDAPLFGTAPLAWSDETIAIPLATSVVLYDTRAPDEPSRWAGDQGGSVLAVVLAPPGDAYVVTSRGTPNGVSVTLTRIDMATTRSVQQVPIPSIFDCCPRVLGVPDGLVLFEIGQVGGRIVHLSKTDDSLRPTIAVGSDFPAAGEPFTLTIAASRRASVAVAWGDGVVERVEPGAVAT
ncbi:MAG TPA: hypothetical protein VI997_01130, partial [Candidatus Thermoplasmatota archaeon]|nr:hypothetical protein [Candidatus Thermoplasmatota archaeon]